jgi:HK97 family phage major capsid protein
MPTLQELEAKRGEQVKAIYQLRDKYDSQGKEWRDDQEANYNKANADYDATMLEIEAENKRSAVDERMKKIDADGRAANNPHNYGKDDDDNKRHSEQPTEERTRRIGFQAYMRSISNMPITGEQEKAMRACGFTSGASSFGFNLFNDAKHKELVSELRHKKINPNEKRALSAITQNKGGALVPSSMLSTLEVNMLYYGGMLQTAETITTDSGAELALPSANDTSNAGSLISENAVQGSTTEPSFSFLRLGAHEYTSGIVLVPRSLIEDAAVDVSSFLGNALAERLGRILNTHCTTGDGANKPSGIVDAATAGPAVTASASAITYDELIDHFYSVDKAYRDSPGVGWMMRDSTVGAIRKLKDSANQYIWKAGANAENVDTILNKPVYTNNDIAAIAANARTVLFGDLSKYKIRRVSSVVVNRLVERYAEYNQIGFNMVMRFDGGLLDAGTAPVKAIVMHS